MYVTCLFSHVQHIYQFLWKILIYVLQPIAGIQCKQHLLFVHSIWMEIIWLDNDIL